ncbi:hypothetical protein Tco_0104456 [Tanacetum coccineum]
MYDTDGIPNVPNFDHYYDNEMYNLFAHEERHPELPEYSQGTFLEQQNNSNIHSETLDMNFGGEDGEQHAVNDEETKAYFESLLHNFKVELDKSVLVNRNDKIEIERLTTELAQYKGQQKFFENNEQKYKELETGYHNTFYEKNCLAKKLEDLTRSSKKTIKTLNSQRTQCVLYNGKVLSNDIKPLSIYDSEEILRLADESPSKMKQLECEIKPINYSKMNIISKVFIPQKVKSRKQSFFSYKTTISKTLSKPVSIVKPQKVFNLDEESSSDTPKKSLARGFLTTVKRHPVTLKHILESKTSLTTTNWNCHVHLQVKESLNNVVSIVNTIDARMIHFEKEFVKLTNSNNESENIVLQKTISEISKQEADVKANLSNRLELLQKDVDKLEKHTVSLEFQLQNQSLTSGLLKNVDLIAQLHEKTFINDELRKIIKGENVNTNFAKPSILGKPPSPKSMISSSLPKSRFAPQVVVENILSKLKCLFDNVQDDCFSKYVNDMNSRAKTHRAKVSKIANHKKLKARKTKTLSKEVKIATPSVLPPRNQKPRNTIRWRPTVRIFPIDKMLITSVTLVGSTKLVYAKEITSNPEEPKSIWFPKRTSLFDRFENDHVAAIQGYKDVEWGNILITRVSYVEGALSIPKKVIKDRGRKEKMKEIPNTKISNKREFRGGVIEKKNHKEINSGFKEKCFIDFGVIGVKPD